MLPYWHDSRKWASSFSLEYGLDIGVYSSRFFFKLSDNFQKSLSEILYSHHNDLFPCDTSWDTQTLAVKSYGENKNNEMM